jgi:hypothetical protein
MSDHVQTLEARRLLSVSISEAEPNNVRTQANTIVRKLDDHMLVSGAVNARGDRDWFKIQLNAGDIVGGALAGQAGLDTTLRLFNNAGKLMIGNDDCGLSAQLVHPPESPLPYNTTNVRDSEIYYTIKTAGAYFVEVSAFEDATAGNYNLDLLVTRPGMEKAPLGSKQILFLDFDGTKTTFLSKTSIDPLVKTLPSWGLTAADESAVIDSILKVVTDKLYSYVAAKGGNANFGLEIRNSRDHADEFGSNPYVSRIAVGPLKGQAFGFDGLAQFTDPGNFKTNDEAVLTTDFIASALQFVSIRPPSTIYDMVSVGVGDLICHEFGHLIGNYHTDQPSSFEGAANIMDPDGRQTLGPDFIVGTKDDVVRQFGVDTFSRNEIFEGINDTLNTVAYALSMGKSAVGSAGIASSATFAASGSRFGVTTIDSRSTFDPLERKNEELAVL